MCIRDRGGRGRRRDRDALRTWVAMGDGAGSYFQDPGPRERKPHACGEGIGDQYQNCLLYTSDAADERSSVDLGGRRIIKKKTTQTVS